jgi:epoxyqueuosine reductase QueG
MKCVERCPVHALSAAGHDKEICGAQLENALAYELAGPLRVKTGASVSCGLCQTGFPDRIGPTRAK